ncbi:MAG: transposase, partial [Burkholderiales bacterium]
MSKTKRARCTLEFKLEAVRLVQGGQSIAAVAKVLGIAEQTLHNWIKAHCQRTSNFDTPAWWVGFPNLIHRFVG